MVPKKSVETEASFAAMKWINTNDCSGSYAKWGNEFVDLPNKSLIRVLPHKAQVWDINGVSVCFSDYCIQEANSSDDIRSLIFLEDGHIYTAWDKLSSKLF